MKEEKLQKTAFQETCIRIKFDLICESRLEFLFNIYHLSRLYVRVYGRCRKLQLKRIGWLKFRTDATVWKAKFIEVSVILSGMKWYL